MPPALGMELSMRSLRGTSRKEGECLGLPGFQYGVNSTKGTKTQAVSGPKKEPSPGEGDCLGERRALHPWPRGPLCDNQVGRKAQKTATGCSLEPVCDAEISQTRVRVSPGELKEALG